MAQPESMPTEDPLDALRERIRATQEAAEKLAGEPRGEGDEQTAREAQALVALLQTLRDMVPPDLWHLAPAPVVASASAMPAAPGPASSAPRV